MKITRKLAVMVLMATLLAALPLLAACGGDDDEDESPTAEPTAEPTTFTIGNITDVTGPAANAMIVVDTGFADLVKHFNDNNLIPGVKLELVNYDSQYDPSKAIPAYEWLLQRGADIIVSGLPPIVGAIYPMATKDQKVLFTNMVDSDAIKLPTWNFAFNVPNQSFIYTALPWLAENDPNFPKDRPAKIGGVGMQGPYAQQLLEALEAYAKAHPDQYQWVDGFQVGFTTMTFPQEVDALKDCDYVVPPETSIFLTTYLKEYRNAGGTATMLATDAHLANLGLMTDALGWDGFDGMLFIVPNRWYDEHADVIDLTNQLLKEYHTPSEIAEYMKNGSAYQGSFAQQWTMLKVIQKAAEVYGPQNLNSQNLYDTATSFALDMNAGQHASFTETKRTAYDYLAMYKASAADQNMVRSSDWLPVQYQP